MEPLGVGTATPREVLWRNEWASPMGTAMTIQNQTTKRGWSFLSVLDSHGAPHNTGKLG
jgi:hypothetical protein